MARKVFCPYCLFPAKLVRNDEVYKRFSGMIWLCKPCKAWVGVHKSNNKPLGTLANYDLRQWRRSAHTVFDPLWKRKMEKSGCSKSKARKAAYRWLSQELGIPEKKTHIAMFDVETCHKVIKLCQPYANRLRGR